MKAARAQVPRPSRAPNTSQQVFGIGGYVAGILQRLQGERTFSPWRDNSLFATATHGLRLPFATRIDGQSLGNGTAFSAVAPSQRPVRRPSIQNIRERYVPPGPNTWTLNIQPLGRFHPHRHFLLARSTLPQQCGSFATYRRLSCPPASTICRCIAARSSSGRRAGLTRAPLRGGSHGRLPAFYRFRGLVRTIASLKSGQNATVTRGKSLPPMISALSLPSN